MVNQSNVHLVQPKVSSFPTTEEKVIVNGQNLNWCLAQITRDLLYTIKPVQMSRDQNWWVSLYLYDDGTFIFFFSRKINPFSQHQLQKKNWLKGSFKGEVVHFWPNFPKFQWVHGNRGSKDLNINSIGSKIQVNSVCRSYEEFLLLEILDFLRLFSFLDLA